MSSLACVSEHSSIVSQIKEDHTGVWLDVPAVNPIKIKNDSGNHLKRIVERLEKAGKSLSHRKHEIGQESSQSAFSPYQNFAIDFYSVRDRDGNRAVDDGGFQKERSIQEIAQEILQELIQRMFQKMQQGRELFKVLGFPIKLERKKLSCAFDLLNQEIQREIDQQSDPKDFGIAKISFQQFKRHIFSIQGDHAAVWFLDTCEKYKHCQGGECAKKIGQGTFGQVYSVKDGSTGIIKTFAVKRFDDMRFFLTEFLRAQVVTAAEIPHALPLVRFCIGANSSFLAYPYIPGGDLHTQIQGNKVFKFSEIMLIMYQLLQTLAVLEKKGITHLDIKAGNLFFHKKELFLGDWGGINIRSFQEEVASVEQTQYIRAPEVLLGLQIDGKFFYTPAADLWSLGCVIFQLIERRFSFFAAGGKMVDEKNIGDPKNLEAIKEQFQRFQAFLPENFHLFFDWLESLEHQGRKVSSIFCRDLKKFRDSFRDKKARVGDGRMQRVLAKFQKLFEKEDRQNFVSQREIFQAVVKIWQRCWDLNPQTRLKAYVGFQILDREIETWKRREKHEILRVWQRFLTYRKSLTFTEGKEEISLVGARVRRRASV